MARMCVSNPPPVVLIGTEVSRVCLKRNNPQVRVDFVSVQGRNPKA